MDGDGKVKVLPLILFVLLIAGFGIGGYYLGMYLDTQELDRKSADKTPTVIKTTKYTNSDLGISFDYPETWAIKEEGLDSDITVVKVISTLGSEFIYTKDTTKDTSSPKYCDTANKGGVVGESEKCEYFQGKSNNNYARFEDLEKDPEGDILNIAEQGSDSSVNWYKYDPNDGFVFVVKGDGDIAYLDGIMITVIRSNTEE
jgi:hypothetical protein